MKKSHIYHKPSVIPYKGIYKSLQSTLCKLTDRIDHIESTVASAETLLISEAQNLKDEFAAVKSTSKLMKTSDQSRLEDLEIKVNVQSQTICSLTERLNTMENKL